MFTRVQARHYRCLKWLDQPLGRFHALVGPNASGKSTFLDVLELLSDLMFTRGDVHETLLPRSSSFVDLLWKGCGSKFQVAVEAKVPETIAKKMAEDKRTKYDSVRYEIAFGLDEDLGEVGIDHEEFWLTKQPARPVVRQRLFFPEVHAGAGADLFQGRGRGRKLAIKKKPGGNDNFYTEGKETFMPSFRLGRTRSALANVPVNPDSFPVSLWFRGLLETGVQRLVLATESLRRPSPPGLGPHFRPDGWNLPWVVEALRTGNPQGFQEWLKHVRTSLEDILDIITIEREEDRHRYLVIEYKNGAKVPSWLVSDGTLRLLALTIIAYLKTSNTVYLIEEPENGVHPRAIETVVQSLSSIYKGQVLMATHSPVTINLLALDQVLCFAKDEEGAADAVSGDYHPALKEWKRGDPDLGVLFATGILS